MDNKQQICHCYKCKKIFALDDANIKERDLCGVMIKEKACPYCGSTTWGSLNHAKWLDRYLKFNY